MKLPTCFALLPRDSVVLVAFAFRLLDAFLECPLPILHIYVNIYIYIYGVGAGVCVCVDSQEGPEKKKDPTIYLKHIVVLCNLKGSYSVQCCPFYKPQRAQKFLD